MLLQLIVIHYDEDESYIKNFLHVLKLQQWVDFNDIEVLIENDGDKVIYNEALFAGYPFSVQYHVNKWSGRSGVRQCGLDRATADYVMFCDCDDTFLRFDSLYEIIFNLKKEKPDVLYSTFKTNFIKDGKTAGFRNYYNENVWIHGKCFRTEFLRTNNLRWNEKLNNFEDVYFVRLVDTFKPKKVGIRNETYAWKYRETGATRNDGHIEMLDYRNAIRSQKESIETLKHMGKFEEAGVKLFVTMYEVYFLTSAKRYGFDFKRDYTNYVSEVEINFLKLYKENKDYLDLVPNDTKLALYNVILERFFKEKGVYWEPKMTLAEYLNFLKDTYKEAC